ncbi:MAG: hypothetical protein ACRDH9_00795 [Actinomycetota bacterium]
MRRSLLATLVALAVGIPAVAGAVTAPTISIGSPSGGTSFSRAVWETIPVSGLASFDVAPATDRTFYLRGEGCGATEEFWLSVESGTDGYDGCGIIGGLPLNEAIGSASAFESRDGVPLLLDASKNVTGQIRAESWFGDGTPGVGLVSVDVTLTGRKTTNQSVTIGTDTLEGTNTGADGVNIPFTFDIPANLDLVALKAVTIDVLVRGANYNSSNLGLSGDSHFTLPIFDPGRVDVSSDSATFSAAKTVQATVEANGTWSAEILVPNTGSRKIYARAVQAGVTTNAAPVSITVTA